MDNEEKDPTEEDLTEQEKEEQASTGATADEAHREGEFDALSEKLDKVLTAIDSMNSTLAVLVKSGAVIVDEDAEEASVSDDVVDDIPDIDDLDLTI